MTEYEEKPNLSSLTEIEQALAHHRDWTGPMLRKLYLSLRQEGFSKQQAWALTRDYCHGMAGGTRT